MLGHLSGKVDLVLTDVMMPTMDGPTMARRVAMEWPDLPVVFMTGYPAETLAALRLLPLHVPRVEKPFRTQALLATIRRNVTPR